MAMGSLLVKVQSHVMPSPFGLWLEGKRTLVSQWLRSRRTNGLSYGWKRQTFRSRILVWCKNQQDADLMSFFLRHSS